MTPGYTVVSIKNSVADLLRKQGEPAKRNLPKQIEFLAEYAEHWKLVSISELPHPADAESVPLVTIRED